jgi:multiple sugar transport system substrate-binding protein
MKTKSIIILSLLVITAILLAGCGGQAAAPAVEEPAEEPAAEQAPTEEAVPVEPTVEEPVEEPAAEEAVTIRALIRPDEGGNVAKAVEEFKADTGIDVQVDFVGWAEIHDKTITTLASGGGGYDIIFIPSANVVEFTSGGWFEPLNDMITDANRGDWLESVVNMYTIDGNLLAMPWYAGGAHMAYNANVLEEAGVDPASIKTWDDFMAACQTIVDSGAAQFCFAPSAKYPGNFYYNWGTMVASYGEDLFNEEGTPIFQDGEAASATMKMIGDATTNGLFDPAGIAQDDYETLISFGAGNSAFLLDSTWAVTQANRNPELSGITDNAGLILIPGGGGNESGGYLYAGGLGVLNSSEHKEEAKQFLAKLTDEEMQKAHAIEGANLPTRTALYQDPEIATAWPGFETLAAQLQYGKFPPQYSWFEEWRRSAATAVQDVMGERKTSEEAIQWLVEETDRLRTQ